MSWMSMYFVQVVYDMMTNRETKQWIASNIIITEWPYNLLITCPHSIYSCTHRDKYFPKQAYRKFIFIHHPRLAWLMLVTLPAGFNGKISHCTVIRTTGPNIGLFVLIMMHMGCLFQIYSQQKWSIKQIFDHVSWKVRRKKHLMCRLYLVLSWSGLNISWYIRWRKPSMVSLVCTYFKCLHTHDAY